MLTAHDKTPIPAQASRIRPPVGASNSKSNANPTQTGWISVILLHIYPALPALDGLLKPELIAAVAALIKVAP